MNTELFCIRDLISSLEKEGWSFIYQGANQGSFSVAQGLGMQLSVQAGLAKNYRANSVGTAQAYSDMSLSTRTLRTGK